MLKSPQNTNGKPMLRELGEPSIERREEAELRLLPRRARRARRKVRADDGDAAKARLDVAPFAIELRRRRSRARLRRARRANRSQRRCNRLSRRARKTAADSRARETLASAMLLFARLELLHAEHVGALPSEPRKKPLRAALRKPFALKVTTRKKNRPVGNRKRYDTRSRHGPTTNERL